ncbi:syntaxin [Phellopilus nigrolimitatus]|nr:syntaxin [Phellopilus nigrolimitatus]
MARDRLAAMRGAQQGANPYGNVPQYELSQISSGSQFSEEHSGMLDDAFYNEIGEIQDEIRKFNANIDQISRLHSQMLDAVDVNNSRSSGQLERMVEETRSLSAGMKKRIQVLQSQPVDARTGNMRRPQIELVRSKFMDAIQKYQFEEKSFRDKHKDRLARQYKIANPNASPEEVNEIVNSDQNVQVFAQATMGNRHAESQSAYREVQQRHEEIKRIEKTLVDLAQLFTDMSVLVEQQGDIVNVIEDNTEKAGANIEAGQGFTARAVISARGYRNKRWICLALTLIILIILGAVIGCEVSGKCTANNTK